MNKNYIKDLLDNKSNPTIFEIGCADGGDTEEFFNILDNPTIYCFEPEPKNIKILKDRFKDNNNFILYEGVVSDKDGELIFHRSRSEGHPEALCYSGSVKTPKDHVQEWPSIKFDNDITVLSITLDSFCKINNVQKIDFIWMDVQGAEDLVISGGKDTLSTKVKYLYTEYSNREYYQGQKNLNEILSQLGDNWEVVQDYSTDVLLKNQKLCL